MLLVALKEDVRGIDLHKLLVDLEDSGLKERQLLELLVGVMLVLVLGPASAVGSPLRGHSLVQHVPSIPMIFLDVCMECRVREVRLATGAVIIPTFEVSSNSTLHLIIL